MSRPIYVERLGTQKDPTDRGSGVFWVCYGSTNPSDGSARILISARAKQFLPFFWNFNRGLWHDMTSKWALLRGLGDTSIRRLLFRCYVPLSSTRVEFPIRLLVVKADSVLTKCFAGFLKCSKFLFLLMLNTIGKLHQHILNEKMKKRKKGQFDTTQCSVMQGDAMHYHSINIILYKGT